MLAEISTQDFEELRKGEREREKEEEEEEVKEMWRKTKPRGISNTR